jgi:short subunit dehydrogenase-like uncharacterized protein
MAIWIFGATGVAGNAIARELASASADVVLIGRDADRLAAVAASLSTPVRIRVVDGAAALALLVESEAPEVLLNTVGPFASTAAPLARACLAARSHYVDLANELEPVQQTLSLHDAASDRGVTLVTGAGFGVLATEALVLALRGDGQPAVRATTAAMPTVTGLGSAVLSSVVDALGYGGRRYRDGGLVRTRLGADHAQIPLPDAKPVDVVAVPTGELEAARRASGAADVIAYSSEVPSGKLIRPALSILSLLLSVRRLRITAQRIIGRMRLTPPARIGHESWAYARLDWADGTTRQAWLHTGEGYRFTARVAAKTAVHLAGGNAAVGAYTPGALLGAEAAHAAGAQLITSPGAVA